MNNGCIDVAFDLADVSKPIVRYRKWKKKCPLFEPQASFGHFPFFVPHNRVPAGQDTSVAFFGFLFLARQEKGVAVGLPPTGNRHATNADNSKSRFKADKESRFQPLYDLRRWIPACAGMTSLGLPLYQSSRNQVQRYA